MMVVLGLIAVIAVAVLVTYNGLIAKRNAVDNVQGSVDVLLKKRADLVPNLVEVVKGYAAHEKQLFERIADLRARGLAGSRPERMRVNAALSNALGQVFAIAEGYPELKANEHFLHLQRTLVELEEQISAGRRAYNAAVTDLNNAVQMFPSSVLAAQMGIGTKPLFEASASDKVLPTVRVS